jgi:FkbM family methyltransferase
MNWGRKLEKLRRQERPWRFLVGRLLLRTRLCRLCLIKTHGYVLRFHPTTLSEEIWYDPRSRHGDIHFLRSYLKVGDTCLDVGANIGNTVLAAAQAVGQAGRVIAFEPHPSIYTCLAQNLRLNEADQVVAHNVALGDHAGEVFFTDLEDDDTNRVGSGRNGIRVELRTLDQFTIDCPAIALLKIDVEGYERLVLSGASRTLEKTDGLYFEVSEEQFQRYGYRTRDLHEMLIGFGFAVYQGAGENCVRRLALDYVPAPGHENLYAFKNEKRFLERTHWRICS